MSPKYLQNKIDLTKPLQGSFSVNCHSLLELRGQTVSTCRGRAVALLLLRWVGTGDGDGGRAEVTSDSVWWRLTACVAGGFKGAFWFG